MAKETLNYQWFDKKQLYDYWNQEYAVAAGLIKTGKSAELVGAVYDDAKGCKQIRFKFENLSNGRGSIGLSLLEYTAKGEEAFRSVYEYRW